MSLNEFKDQCLGCVESFDNFESDLITFLADLNELGSIFKSKILNFNNRESFCNPYIILMDWSYAEILDLEAILEAIETRRKYLGIIEKIELKIDNMKKNLNKIQAGKKSLSQIFSKKSKEEMSADSAKEIDALEYELKNSKDCFRVISLRLIKKEIAMFKQAKIDTYKHIMKVFSTASIQEISILVQQVKCFEFFIE